jgi:hypothetical protein
MARLPFDHCVGDLSPDRNEHVLAAFTIGGYVIQVLGKDSKNRHGQKKVTG